MRSVRLSWPSNTDRPLRAVLFDVDGTLYRLGPMRRRMRARLVAECLKHPARGYTAIRLLSAYRKAQEHLRREAQTHSDIAAAQLAAACVAARLSKEAAAPVIRHWMEVEPLKIIAASLRGGTVELLNRLRRSGIRVAAVSDYPCERKLDVLGIRQWFDTVVCAQDPEVQRFKPNPRGIEVALHRLGVSPDEALYVGDRPEVDDLAAQRAGVRSVILRDGDALAGTIPLTGAFSEKTRHFPARHAGPITGD